MAQTNFALSNLPATKEQDLQHLVGRDLEKTKLRVICVGAHPDDAETGCGGTLARFSRAGHEVTIVYLTRGEAGIKGTPGGAAAAIRAAESENACKVLGVAPLFTGQIDGATEISREQYTRFHELLKSLNPDIVFTHWPLDTHIDHRTASLLAYQAWQWSSEKFALVYYEVMPGIQTHHFQPDSYIDISETWSQKRSAIYAHVSQNPDRFYGYHERIEQNRGAQAGYERAEAFVVLREKLPKPFLVKAIF